MKTYTEQDMQDYLDGNFTADTDDLQNYLKQNPEAQKAVEIYHLLYAAIKEQPRVSLSIDLANSVVGKIEKREKAKELRWTQAAFITTSMLVVIALIVSYKYFGMENLYDVIGAGLLLLCILFFFAFVFGFHFIELQVKKKKFTVSFNQRGY